MFTGIVEAVGTVEAVERLETARRVRIAAPGVSGELGLGDSVAVDGACLTVVERDADAFAVEVVATTLSRTVAGRYREGSRVNLERALRLGGRLDGHLVQGHVDGVGRVRDVRPEGEHRLVDFDLPREVARYTVLHGSVTLNGVSLTVNALPSEGVAQVALIPHTLEVTTLGLLEAGTPVNLEADLIGKYVGRMLAPHLPDASPDRTP